MKPTYYNWGLTPEKPFVIRMQEIRGDYKTDMDYNFHESIHMNIVMQGDYGGDVCGTPYWCLAGEALVTAPWEPHKAICSKNGAVCYMIALSLHEVNQVLLDKGKVLTSFLSLPPEKRFELLREKDLMKYFYECGKAISLCGENSTLLCWKAIVDCMILLVDSLGDLTGLEMIQDTAKNDFTRLLPALRRINSGRKVTTAAEAANLCNLSTSRFRMLFRQIFRKTFAAYELQYRLNCAADDILHARMTVKDASFEWGFFDISHFSRLFKKQFGCTPGTYKRKKAAKE